jgi:hypothetical protein
MLDGDYYAMNGTYLGSDGINDDKVYAVENSSYTSSFNTTIADGYMSGAGLSIIVSSSDGNNFIDKSGITDLTAETGVTHSEFQQIAAFANNETYDNNTIDKYRVANAIVNRKDDGHTFQQTIDKVRYNNDSQEDRMNNVQKLPGTATKTYVNFMNTNPTERNNNPAMKTSNAATANALNPNGINYTTSLDGKSTATQWRGANAGSTSNRFFTAFPPKPSNQITNFKHDTIH